MTTTQKIVISALILLALGLGTWMYFVLFYPPVTTERDRI
nr:MAG TPA: Lipopolysaccharide export system ATP-binding protein transport, ABC-transporter, LIPID TRANSPORT [Caudoviricetes sp.]